MAPKHASRTAGTLSRGWLSLDMPVSRGQRLRWYHDHYVPSHPIPVTVDTRQDISSMMLAAWTCGERASRTTTGRGPTTTTTTTINGPSISLDGRPLPLLHSLPDLPTLLDSFPFHLLRNKPPLSRPWTPHHQTLLRPFSHYYLLVLGTYLTSSLHV